MALKPSAAAAATLAVLASIASTARADPPREFPPVVIATPAPPPVAKPSVGPETRAALRARLARAAVVAAACKVAVAEVKDVRSDAQMGEMGWKVVRAADPAEWVRGGLNGLTEGAHVVLVDPAGPSDVELKVEILKAYIQSINSAKAANVVLRVRYGGPHAPAEPRIYRGIRTAINWAGTTDEVNGAMNLALGEAVKNIRLDLMGICWLMPKG